MIARRQVLVLGAAGAAAPAAFGQPARVMHPDLMPLARFVGTWRGESEGQPGRATVERSYEPVLRRFIKASNRSTYAPQPKNPKGEVHEDIGYLSFDRARKLFVLRQFHVEGFVNQYVASPAAPPATTLVFESEAIENVPAGFRARETYRFSSDGAFEEVFELAEPGKPFAVYSHARLKRI